ncbi:tetracycline regulation of excision, RteC [Chryseobacterium sp. IHB B 17019]|uniref:RteC domain-containing protein n=1 Tax=Chryseobacterium sp. IHB B 17019 TaxID=1721091 RepID=UPI00071F1CE7|nr:RteC domain-containing protein [Chryseobacterium sp. IHB B 17019]ALR29219.1 tetracycline regulation of excision, RteC [Chryseobacterium sp. IHB B 17019]
MKNKIYDDVLRSISAREKGILLDSRAIIDDSYRMTLFLHDLLSKLKDHVLKNGFSNKSEEVEFFKEYKPQILGKLIYYNKLYRIETGCPCPISSGKLYQKYYSSELHHLKQEYIDQISGTDFFRYYRSGRSDLDHQFFELGKINFNSGLSSYVFEIDEHFSTYYDYKIAKIVAYELLLKFLLTKINADYVETPATDKEIFWTESKNALVELIYALHCSESIAGGRVGISKISAVMQDVFRIKLGDIHHAFHKMKFRAGSRTVYLDNLKASVENYMDRDLGMK